MSTPKPFRPLISGLADSRVSLSRRQVSSEAKPTRGTFGPFGSDYFAWFDPDSYSLKTFQVSLLTQCSAEFSATLPRSGTMRNGRLSEHMKLERPTGAIDSGLLVGTPLAQADRVRSEEFRKGRTPSPVELATKTEPVWPTPVASNPGAGPDSKKVKNLLSGSRHSFYLSQAVEAERQKPGIITERFPTPTVGDSKSAGSRNLEGSNAHAGVSLTDHVKFGNSKTPRKLLPTPVACAERIRGKNATGGPALLTVVKDQAAAERATGSDKLWPTPTSAAGLRGGSKPPKDLNERLKQKMDWPTPLSGDKGSAQWKDKQTAEASNFNETLTSTVCLEEDDLGGKLNPVFVEWLMGYAPGWTDTEVENISALEVPPWADGEWEGVGRLIDNVPKRVARLRCLGNAVVPQVVEWIAKRIR